MEPQLSNDILQENSRTNRLVFDSVSENYFASSHSDRTNFVEKFCICVLHPISHFSFFVIFTHKNDCTRQYHSYLSSAVIFSSHFRQHCHDLVYTASGWSLILLRSKTVPVQKVHRQVIKKSVRDDDDVLHARNLWQICPCAIKMSGTLMQCAA